MKAEDIIEGLNKFIEDKRNILGIKTTGHLVLQRVIELHQIFKVYKKYKFVIWFIKNNKKHKVITIRKIARILNGQEETIIREMGVELSRLMFNWIGSDFYEQVIKGEYNGYIDE